VDIKLIISAWTLHFLALISPGPDFVLALRNTLKHGRFLGLATALGFGLGICVHATYCIAGIALFLKYSPQIIGTLRILGSLYLIWIGIEILRAFFTKDPATKIVRDQIQEANSFNSCLTQGFITNILNPKATLFIISIYTSLIDSHANFTSLILAGLGMATLTVGWFSGVAWFFSQERIQQKYLKAEKLINLIFACFFICTGCFLLFK
jgi:threonine/homoserine/homoserine lactone efflux protein